MIDASISGEELLDGGMTTHSIEWLVGRDRSSEQEANCRLYGKFSLL
jgi:hypothetical protein